MPNGIFWAAVHEIISIRLVCAQVQQQKSQEGNEEEKSQNVYNSWSEHWRENFNQTWQVCLHCGLY